MAGLQLGSVIVGPRGNKSAPLSRGNKPVTCKLPPTSCPFNAGVFGDQLSTRLNLELHVGQEEYQKFLNEIDEFCIKALAKDSAQYFPKKKTEDEIRTISKPSITQREKDGIQYEASMRAKII